MTAPVSLASRSYLPIADIPGMTTSAENLPVEPTVTTARSKTSAGFPSYVKDISSVGVHPLPSTVITVPVLPSSGVTVMLAPNVNTIESVFGTVSSSVAVIV